MGSQPVEQSVARSAEKTQEKRGNEQSSVPQSSSHGRQHYGPAIIRHINRSITMMKT
jgi:hypothetical protein